MTDADISAHDALLEAINTITSRESAKAFRRMPPADAVHLVGRISKTITVVLSNVAMRPPGNALDPDAAQEAAVALEHVAPVMRAAGEVHGLALKSMSRRARAR